MKGKALGTVFFLLLTASCLSSCHSHDPMTLQESEAFFKNNSANIQATVHYLKSLGYDSAGIFFGEGIYEGKDELTFHNKNDFSISRKPLKDEAVYEAAKRLHENGCHEIYFDIGTNRIEFVLGGALEVGWGIALSLDGKNPPEVDYMTECVPMQEAGWFYYVSDFNKWRIQQKRTTNPQ